MIHYELVIFLLNLYLTDDYFCFYDTWTGAGGTFALYSLLCRHMKIGIISTRDADSSGVSNTDFSEGQRKQSGLGQIFVKSVVARRILLFISILGMCMLIGDGILTPAISGLFLILSFILEWYLDKFVLPLPPFSGLIWMIFCVPF